MNFERFCKRTKNGTIPRRYYSKRDIARYTSDTRYKSVRSGIVDT